jgi:tripartite-type tricarboxylate transporter receptor subunit TctC
MKKLTKMILGVALCSVSGIAASQSYPARQVRVIVPYPPGGTVDVVARVITEALSQQMGQTFIVDNRAGAAGAIGSETVARAPADGYTLLINASTFVASPMLMKNVPYDIQKDFTAISELGEVPLLITANPAVPANNLKEFIDIVRADPKKYYFGTSAVGSASHLAEEAIKYQAKLGIEIIPYKGTGPALTDVMGGHISAMIDAIPSSLPPVKGGKLKSLAVTSAQRLPSLPDVPTVAESGLEGFEMVSWYGLWGPAKLPDQITRKLQAEVVKALKSPHVAQILGEQAFINSGSTPEEFSAYVTKEHAKYQQLIKEANIQIE